MKSTDATLHAAWLEGQEQTLLDISSVWLDTELESLRWDNLRGVFCGNRSAPTYRALYGSWSMFRQLHSARFALGRLRRAASPARFAPSTSFRVMVPKGVVLWFKWDGRVLFAASAPAGRFVKIVRGANFKRHMLEEIGAWERVRAAGVAAHVPALLGHGELGEAGYWICMQLVPDSPSVRPSVQAWLQRMRADVFPMLQKYYEHTGVETLEAVEWVKLLRREATRMGVREELEPVLASVDRLMTFCPKSHVARSIVHGDLKPDNVRYHKGEWWVFDWSASSRVAIIWDCFSYVFYRCYSESPGEEGMQFWRWVSGAELNDSMPSHIRPYANLWSEWQRVWLGVSVTDSDLRFQLLGMCVEWFLFMRTARGAKETRLLRLLGY